MMLLVGLGGIFGAIARFLLGKWITAKKTGPFPMGTWVINLSGSFVLGFLAVLHDGKAISDWVWFLCGTGFLGAYTTFSTFGYETIQLIQKQKAKIAILYVFTSVLLGVIFAWIGASFGSVIIY